MKIIVIATGNAHKVHEFQTAFAQWKDSSGEEFEFIALSSLGDFPEPVEDGDSFEANARIKALAAFYNTGLPALADDSGLEVDALDGAPGIYSSRYAGDGACDGDNNKKLLAALENVAEVNRTARFRCTLVYINELGEELVVNGTCEGRIALAPRGEEGFGYDPLFLPDATPGKHMAELTIQEKQAISHRGNAIEAFKAALLGA